MKADTRIGTKIGGYAVESLLGRGGMSVVYLAVDAKLGRRVALKIMSEELAENESFRTRFVREAEMAANLEHPNIVPVYDAGDADGVLYLAMRVIRGTDLRRVITGGGPMEVERSVAILRQVGGALDAAHRAGLVHRDVKPANILLTEDGGDEHAYLSDFGLTKHASSKSGLTRTGQFMGTLDYVAPEQIRGNEVDGRTDIYSLGCVLYESLTAKVPYVKDQDVAILFAHLEDPVPLVTDVRPELPAAVDEVVARAMAKQKDDRFATCAELVVAARLAMAETPRASVPGPTIAAAAPTILASPPGVEEQLEPHPSFPPDEVSTGGTSLPPFPPPVPDEEPALSAPRGLSDATALAPQPSSTPGQDTTLPDEDVVPERAADGVVTLPAPAGPPAAVPEAPPVPPAPRPGTPLPGRQGSGGRGKVIALVALVLAVLIGFGVFALVGGGDEEEPGPSAPPTPSVIPSPSATDTPSPPSPSPTGSPEANVDPVRAPLNLRTSATSDAIALEWGEAPNGGRVVFFSILRDGELIKEKVRDTVFVDEDVSPSTTYEYQVVAVGADGSRAKSKKVDETTPAASSGGASGGNGTCTIFEAIAGECVP